MSQHLREEEFVLYLDGRVNPAEQSRLDDHLAACADCCIRLDELRALMGVLGEWKAVEPSPGFSPALRARLDEETRHRERWAGLRPAYAAALGVAVLVAVTVGLWQWAPSEVGTPPQGSETAAVLPSVERDSLTVLDNPVLMENYELLEQFDILFEPAGKEEEKL